MEKLLFLIGCLLPVSVCFYTDVKDNLIYNKVTGPMFLVGIGGSIYMNRLGDAVLGIAIGFGILMICSLMGGIGGGDVKLSAALGAWFGYKIVWVLVVGSLICVLWGGWKLYKQGSFKARVKLFCKGMFYRLAYGMKETLILPKLEDASEETIPFGACLAVASWAVLLI